MRGERAQSHEDWRTGNEAVLAGGTMDEPAQAVPEALQRENLVHHLSLLRVKDTEHDEAQRRKAAGRPGG